MPSCGTGARPSWTGRVNRRNGSIVLMDDDRHRGPPLELHQWMDFEVGGAEPERGRANEVAIETIEIAHEGLRHP